MSEPPPPRPSGPPLKPDGSESGPPPPPLTPPPAGPPGWEEAWYEQAAIRSRTRRAALAAVGLLAIVALLASALISMSGDDPVDEPGDAAAELPTTTTPTGPTAPGGSGAPVGEDELRAVVDEISVFVEQERGLAFREDVTVELAADDEFEARLLEDFEEDADELERTDVLMTAFGLIDPGVDLVVAMRELLGGGVVGFYDAETEELVVRGTSLSPYVRTTIAHELVHALDDQHFELDRPEYEDADDEVGFGFSAVAEGNARRVEDAYTETFSDEEQAAATAEELAIGADIDVTGIPFVLFELLESPYSDGLEFVRAVLEDGGQEALDRAFSEPPRTSEQVVDPESYLAGDERLSVPHPEPSGELVDEGVAGQQLIHLVLGGMAAQPAATQAAEGWGGDWAVVWRDGDRSCVTMTVVGDTDGDTVELREALAQWADDQDDASVSGGAGEPVTVEACAG
jgi:hypothetical protein